MCLVSSFTCTVTTGQYKARVSLAEADRIFKFVNFQHTGTMTAAGTFHFVSMTDYLVDRRGPRVRHRIRKCSRHAGLRECFGDAGQSCR